MLLRTVFGSICLIIMEEKTSSQIKLEFLDCLLASVTSCVGILTKFSSSWPCLLFRFFSSAGKLFSATWLCYYYRYH